GGIESSVVHDPLAIRADRRRGVGGLDDTQLRHGVPISGVESSRSSSSSRISAGLTVATPALPTPIPAARLATTAASRIVAPAARATATKAVTVSPAPETS